MNFKNRIVTANLSNVTLDISFEYNTTIIEAVKKIPGRKWDKGRSVWTLPLSDFHCQEAIETLTSLGFDFDARVYKMAEPKKKVSNAYFPNREGLFPFQDEAVQFIHQKEGRVLLADEMGLGKTIEALGWVRERPDLEYIIIVCPASVVFKWEREIRKWVGEEEKIGVLLTGSQSLPESRWLIMSYAIMVAQQGSLKLVDWDLVILDEAHKIKDSKSQRSRCAQSLQSRYVMLLTGSPMLNRPKELFNLLKYINPAEWNDFFDFGVRYCNGHKNYFGWDFNGASNITELRDRLKPYMIRRTKKEVLTQLPDLTRTKIPVIVRREEIRKALEELQYWIKENGSQGASRAEAMVRLSKLRQAMGMAKVPVVLEMAEDILEQGDGQKVVIYAVHKAVVSALVSELSKDYSVSTITGEVSQEDRQKRIDNFQNHQNPRVMVISSAGGEGIDLYSADRIIFAEREWTPAAEEQAEARCHRFGQKNAVEAIYLVASDTVDREMDSLVESKRSLFKDLIGQDLVSTANSTINEFLKLVGRR